MVFLNELYTGENRVKQFRDKTMSCIRVRRGLNQKEEPYLGENVLPKFQAYIKISSSEKIIWFVFEDMMNTLNSTF